jgi:acetylornithine deacetylase
MMKAIPAIRNVKLRYTPREDLPALPMILVGAIIGGRGRDHDLKGPNYNCDYCTVLVDVRFLPSQTSQTIEEDLRAVLDGLKADDPDFEYEIVQPPPAQYRTLRVVMEPTDVPVEEEIVQTVIKHIRAVTGEEPREIGVTLPMSYAGDDTCHLWRAGIPCLLYGPAGSSGTPDEVDHYIVISEMELASKVLELTALDVCNQTTD